jgi:hypothetical protein
LPAFNEMLTYAACADRVTSDFAVWSRVLIYSPPVGATPWRSSTPRDTRNGRSGRAGNPSEIVAKLNNANTRAIATPSVQETLKKLGVEPKASTP